MDNDQKKLYYGIMAIMVVVAVVSVIFTLNSKSQETQRRLLENEVLSKQANSVVAENTAE